MAEVLWLTVGGKSGLSANYTAFISKYDGGARVGLAAQLHAAVDDLDRHDFAGSTSTSAAAPYPHVGLACCSSSLRGVCVSGKLIMANRRERNRHSKPKHFTTKRNLFLRIYLCFWCATSKDEHSALRWYIAAELCLPRKHMYV